MAHAVDSYDDIGTEPLGSFGLAHVFTITGIKECRREKFDFTSGFYPA